MTTDTNPTSRRPDEPVEPSPIEDVHAGWRAMLDEWLRYQWRWLSRGRNLDDEDWPPSWAPPVIVIAGVVVAVAVIVMVLIPLLRGIARLVVWAVRDGGGWLHDWSATRVVLDPVHHYLEGHAAGLPVDPATLRWTWVAAGVVLFLLAAAARVVAARVGWCLYGATTVAMVWAASPQPSRTVAAGIAGLWWTALSVSTFRRRWSRPHVVADLPDLHILARLLADQRDHATSEPD